MGNPAERRAAVLKIMESMTPEERRGKPATLVTHHSDEAKREWRKMMEAGHMVRIPGTLKWRKATPEESARIDAGRRK